MRHLPERGRIGIFNRSYYEEVLVVRVHPELLARQRLPRRLVTKRIWKERFDGHPRRRALPGAQRRRDLQVLPARLAEGAEAALPRAARIEPDKHWKFSATDVGERRFWDDYMAAYEDAIRNTATEHAPWYVVPADNKWFTRLIVAAAIIDTLSRLDLCYPEVNQAQLEELEAARRELLAE